MPQLQTSQTAPVDRRRFERFTLQPMLTTVIVRRVREGRMQELRGHAYDISEGGLRIELDERLDVGEPVNVEVSLPGANPFDNCRTILAACEVVWVNDELDDPAAPRMALRIVHFHGDGSRERLLRYFGTRALPRAA